MKFAISRFAVLTAAAACAAPFAAAQDNPFARDKFTSVQDRAQPEFDPEPVQLGAFMVRSELGVGAQLNDNVYASQTTAQEDTIFKLRPRADFESTWSRHGLRFGGEVTVNEYQDQSDESTTDYNGYFTGKLDVGSNVSVTAGVNAGHYSEKRWDAASISNQLEPTQYDRVNPEIGVNYRSERFQVDSGFGRVTDEFEDVRLFSGGTTSNAFRDNKETYARGRASYAVSPDVALFVQARHSDIEYDTAVGPVVRDATRTTVQGGLNFELNAPFRGDIAVGYTEEDKASAALRDLGGLSVDGRLLWFPTDITTVTFTANRNFYDPGLINLSQALVSRWGVRADHELRRNIVLFGGVTTGQVEYEGAAATVRTDDLLDIDFGLGYKINKRVRLDFGYTRRDQDSSGALADRDFDQNIFDITLKLHP